MKKNLILFVILICFKTHAIVGGRFAESNEMPSVVYLSYDDCSAVVIGKNSYVTAAHCVLDLSTLKLRTTMLKESKQRIYPLFMGGISGQLATVKEVKVHPSYLNSLKLTNSIRTTTLQKLDIYDLAKVTIEEDFPIAPASLNKENLPTNARTAIVGFGCVHPGMNTGGSKQKIAFKDNLKVTKNTFSSPAIDLTGVSYTCPGDSGGAVFYRPTRTNLWLLAGINRFAGNPLEISSDPEDIEALKQVESTATMLDISFLEK